MYNVSCPLESWGSVLLPYCICWLWFANVLEITARRNYLAATASWRLHTDSYLSGIKKMVRPGSGCGHLVMCEPAANGC